MIVGVHNYLKSSKKIHILDDEQNSLWEWFMNLVWLPNGQVQFVIELLLRCVRKREVATWF